MKKQRTPKNGQEAQESGGSEVFHSWQGVLENSKVAAHISYPALAASKSAAPPSPWCPAGSSPADFPTPAAWV